MKLVFLVLGQNHAADRALAAANEQMAAGHQISQIFLYGNGAGLPKSADAGNWVQWADQHDLDILVCASHAARLGLSEADIKAPFEIAGLGQWVTAAGKCDQMWTFGADGNVSVSNNPLPGAAGFNFVIDGPQPEAATWVLNMAMAAAAYDKPVTVTFAANALGLLDQPPKELAVLADLGVSNLFAAGPSPCPIVKEIGKDRQQEIMAQGLVVGPTF